MKHVRVLNNDKSERDYFAVPCSKELSLLSKSVRDEYLALKCAVCGGKIAATHKYTVSDEGAIAHLNCPPK